VEGVYRDDVHSHWNFKTAAEARIENDLQNDTPDEITKIPILKMF
jgi:hypothetical protein